MFTETLACRREWIDLASRLIDRDFVI